MLFPALPEPYTLTPVILTALQHRFPLADVERELSLMVLWLAKHPARTPKRPLRFIENWLAKASPKAPLVDMSLARTWQTNNEATLVMAKRIGVTPKPGEEWPSLRARIRAKLAA